MPKFRRKIAFIMLLSIFATSFSPLTARKAHAQWVVFDPGNFANTLATMLKDYGLDGFAFKLSSAAGSHIVQSTVNWINSGFRGAPSFVTDPQKYFVNVADQTAAEYIFSNPALNNLCGPLQQRIRLSLARNYVRNNDYIYGCTLTGVVGNIEGFMNDFQQGGWEGFFELSQVQQNSPIGAYLIAEGDLFATVSTQQKNRENELNWGSGFLSLKTCKRWATKAPNTVLGTDIGGETDPETGIPFNVDRSINPPPSADKTCVEYATETPGDVISNSLNNALNLGNEKLISADEINEIISALLGQLMNKAMGGLRSLSRSNNGEQSFTQQLGAPPTTPIVGYFEERQNTRVLDVYSSTDPNNPDYRYSAIELSGIDPDSLVYPPTNLPPIDQTPADTNCQFWRPEQWATWASEQGVEIQYITCPIPEPGTQRSAESGSRGAP